MTLSRSEKARYRALKLKKGRDENRLFVIDGIKSVKEALAAGFPLVKIMIAPEIGAAERQSILSVAVGRNISVSEVAISEIDSISSLRNPEGVLAIAGMPDERDAINHPHTYPALYLWQINDPGNLGTILRTALWFDFKTILISPDSADIYSPKVVRGAMGALFRLNILTNINQQMISDLLERDGASLWAADMDGAEILPQVNDERFILAFGSESHGLPNKVRQAASGIIGIKKNGYGESLNLAVAAGIILSRIRGQSGS